MKVIFSSPILPYSIGIGFASFAYILRFTESSKLWRYGQWDLAQSPKAPKLEIDRGKASGSCFAHTLYLARLALFQSYINVSVISIYC